MNLHKLSQTENLYQRTQYIPLTGPDLDDAFYVFAIRVCSDHSVGKRKLSNEKPYYLLDGFTIYEDRILVSKERYKKTLYDYYVIADQTLSPHITISAIVGENGSGKSSLVEFEMRLINNFSAVVFGEFAKENGWHHLHFIDGVDGELYYLLKQNIYQLKVSDRKVELNCYLCQEQEEEGQFIFKPAIPPINIIGRQRAFPKNTPIKSIYYNSYFESLKQLLPRFFYTIAFNQSAYAYNTSDFKEECNSEHYEVTVRNERKKNEKGEEILYSTEDKCWLGGLFHKNDGYQIPIVLTPCRFEGNYDINTENKLAYERLVSIMVRAKDSDRVINGHLKVTSFDLVHKKASYDIAYIHKHLGYHQFSTEDFSMMRDILLHCWGEHLGHDILENSRSFVYRTQAVNYLVYKTLKIADTYDEYRDFRYQFQKEAHPFDKMLFKALVERTIANVSHVTNKLFRTVAYLVWGIYEIHGVLGDRPLQVRIDDITNRWMTAIKDTQYKMYNSIISELILEAAIPPPFFETSIGLVDIKKGVYVPFKYLSSGEKQQAYISSSIAYHLKNLDSVSNDLSTNDRIAYEYVQLILEEVELYYHPELQRQFVRNLLDGIKQAGLSHIKWISICIVTHSPFVLSDIPAGNVLALKKDGEEIGKIPSFGANIHEMLKLSFFLENGSVGDFAKWTTSRIAKCLRVFRWINGIEDAPAFFPSLVDVPQEYSFLEEFKTIINGLKFSIDGFKLVYSPDVILFQINLIEEPIIRRVLLDDYKRTFPKNEKEYKDSMRSLLQSQLNALD